MHWNFRISDDILAGNSSGSPSRFRQVQVQLETSESGKVLSVFTGGCLSLFFRWRRPQRMYFKLQDVKGNARIVSLTKQDQLHVYGTHSNTLLIRLVILYWYKANLYYVNNNLVQKCCKCKESIGIKSEDCFTLFKEYMYITGKYIKRLSGHWKCWWLRDLYEKLERR